MLQKGIGGERSLNKCIGTSSTVVARVLLAKAKCILQSLICSKSDSILHCDSNHIGLILQSPPSYIHVGIFL